MLVLAIITWARWYGQNIQKGWSFFWTYQPDVWFMSGCFQPYSVMLDDFSNDRNLISCHRKYLISLKPFSMKHIILSLLKNYWQMKNIDVLSFQIWPYLTLWGNLNFNFCWEMLLVNRFSQILTRNLFKDNCFFDIHLDIKLQLNYCSIIYEITLKPNRYQIWLLF